MVELVLFITLNILERRAVLVKQESETDDRISYLINMDLILNKKRMKLTSSHFGMLMFLSDTV